MLKTVFFIALCLIVPVAAMRAQDKSADTKTKPLSVPQPALQTSKKSNQRPAAAEASKAVSSEPFDKASVEAMAAQCVKFETEAGIIEIEMFPESAPESVRSFLNLSATGAFDTTAFSRIVAGFIIQGGDLFTSRKMTPELSKRARRTLPDEPSLIKHERGIVSMARPDAPNSATTNFFILVGDAPHLDGTFAAFGRVRSGMEIADAISKMPVEGDKPINPVHITRATVAPCPVQTKP